MRARLDGTAVAEWQRLMAEWDGASRELDEAGAAAAALAPGDTRRAPLDATIARLAAKLQDLQSGIDSLVKQTQSVRDPQRQDLIVATIKRGLTAPDHSGAEAAQPTSRRITGRSK